MCEECGAPGNQCQELFNDCLAMEFENALYGKVHNLTVSTFMLQHSSRLTREGWLYERGLLHEFLVDDKQPQQVRKERKQEVDSSKRTFKIKSRTGQPVIPSIRWAKTIMDVRLENPEHYCSDVTVWASATLQDAERIILAG